MAASSRTLILVGLGALAKDRAGTTKALEQLADAADAHVLTSYKAKGAIDEAHPRALGSFGLSPTVDTLTLELINEAHTLVLVGLDPIELRDAWLDAWPKDWETAPRVITVDRTHQTHAVFPTADMPLVAELAPTLATLAAEVADRDTRQKTHAWPDGRLATFQKAVADVVAPRASAGKISAAGVFEVVNAWLETAGNDRDTPLTIDVGAHRILGSHVLKLAAPGQMLQSNGLCCMGYAIPAAAGVALATGVERLPWRAMAQR